MLKQKINKITLHFLVSLRRQLAPYARNKVAGYLRVLCYKYLGKFLPTFYSNLDTDMMLALTYKCQCGCEHCGSNLHRKEGKEELKRKEILDLIDEHYEAGGTGVYFFGGEPLIVEDLPYYIRYAKSKGLFTRLDTNGFLLDKNMARELKSSGLDLIGVSLDSPDEATHDELRRLKGVFSKAINGIKYCKEYRIPLYISTYATKKNLQNGDLLRLVNFAKGNSVWIRILSPICSGKWLNKRDVVLSQDEIILLRNLCEKGKVSWEEVVDKGSPFFCGALKKKFFYVSSYGDIQSCCYLPVIFGNIREEPLKQIVKRMHSSKAFKCSGKLSDCPANDENFMDTLSCSAGSGSVSSKLPERRISSEDQDKKEWDEWASSYSKEVDHLLGINDDLICSRVDFTGKKVLDVGCGTGRFAKAIARDAKYVTLLDFSNKMLDEAKKELRKFNNVDFKNLDIETKDFLVNEKFDVIVSISLLHHLNDINLVLERLKSRLQPGGRLVILDTLGKRPRKDNFLSYFKIIRKYGILKPLGRFLYGKYFPTLLKKHLSKEEYITFNDFKNRYEPLLPGSEAEVVNGVFGLLIWPKK